jgi:hypothetical protein
MYGGVNITDHTHHKNSMSFLAAYKVFFKVGMYLFKIVTGELIRITDYLSGSFQN